MTNKLLIIKAVLLVYLTVLGLSSAWAGSDEVRIPIDTLPVTITASGSYYLTGNLSVTDPAAHGITVNADNVSIDLMGFSITGPGTGSGSGLYMDGRSTVTIQNGTIRAFGNSGILENNLTGHAHLVADIRSLENGGAGIRLNGKSHLVRHCVTTNNGNYGIDIGDVSNPHSTVGSTMTGNTSSHNGGHGIRGVYGCTITNNTSHNNGGDGIHGYLFAAIIRNTVYRNSFRGIYAISSLVDKNTAVDNSQISPGSYDNIFNSSSNPNTLGTNHAP